MKLAENNIRPVGDDYSLEQIEKWYSEEAEAFANLIKSSNEEFKYTTHKLNIYYGFKYLKSQKLFKNVLGIGAAHGEEFRPIAHKIEKLTILESSTQFTSENDLGVKPTYVRPNSSGKLPFDNNSFELITCFGVLHHIPNFSFVLSEMSRVLKPNGYALIREPIDSMGDTPQLRRGLTINERGIPIDFFRETISKVGFNIIHENRCFTMNSFLQRSYSKISSKKLESSYLYLFIDKILSKLFSFNIHYFPKNKWQRIAPQCVFFVVKKD